MNNSNMPAMPVYDRGGALSHSEVSKNSNAGFTKREEIASRTMAGILANPGAAMSFNNSAELLVDVAVEYTDLLLKKLEGNQ